MPNTSYNEGDFNSGGNSVALNAAHPTDNIQGSFAFRNGQNGRIVRGPYLLEEELPLACNSFGTLATP